MSEVKIDQFRVGESNYNYIIYSTQTKKGIVIDPLEAGPVLDRVKRLGLNIPWVINTHGHADHTAGNAEVMQATGAQLAAPEGEGIDAIDRPLKGGDTFDLDDIHLKILSTPGHTPAHVSLIVDDHSIMVGDTLFLGGCGNCKFGGNPDILFDTAEFLKTLPGHLKMYVGHEYAEKNLEFGQTHEPDNPKVSKRLEWAKKQLEAKQHPVTTLAEEKEHNVFLRCDQKDIWQKLESQNSGIKNEPRAVFKKLRDLRNTF